MNCELFSVRSSQKEFEIVESSIPKLVKELSNVGINLLYKTDVDRTPDKLNDALKQSVNSEDAPRLIIIANALNSKDNSSFIELFSKAIVEADARLDRETNIKLLGNCGDGYPAFSFMYYETLVVVLPQIFLCGNNIINASIYCIQKAIDLEKAPSPPPKRKTAVLKPADLEEISKEVGGKKKKGFLKSVFPTKGDKTGTVVSKILVLVFSLVFLVSAVLLANDLLIEPMINNYMRDKLKDALTGESSTVDPTRPDGITDYDEFDFITKDWTTLHEINTDILGWIRIKNTNVDYPVLHSESDENPNEFYYLYRNYNKEYTKYGSIFLDHRTADNLNSNFMLLHGHHMKDGSMFADLVDYGTYSGDLEQYKNAPIVTIETEDGVTKWIIFSVFKSTTNSAARDYFDYFSIDPSSTDEFMEYVYKSKVRSFFDVPVNINENDRLLVLSTCSYEYTDYRTIVVARQLREGELSTPIVEGTTLNSNPLWPQEYYDATGTFRPEVSDFKTALKDNGISWYDGSLYSAAN